MTWAHAEKWNKRGKHFNVEIYRWGTSENYHWNVYVYVFDKHEMFQRLSGTDLSNCSMPCIEVHSYCSHFSRENEDCFKIGWDYAHDGDWEYSHHKTLEEAWRVVRDAEALYKYMESWGETDVAF